MNMQASSIDNREISTAFNQTTLDCSEFNNKRFHITIINHNCTNVDNVYTIGSRPHKEFRIYREPSEINPDSKDNKQLHHKIFHVKRNSVKNNQDDLIIFD